MTTLYCSIQIKSFFAHSSILLPTSHEYNTYDQNMTTKQNKYNPLQYYFNTFTITITITTRYNIYSNQGTKSKGGCVLCLLSLMNMGLAAMMTALGVLTIIQVHRTGLGWVVFDNTKVSSGNNCRYLCCFRIGYCTALKFAYEWTTRI